MDFHARPGYGTSTHTAIPALNLALASGPLAFPPFGDFHLEPNGLIFLPRVTIPVSTGKGSLEVTVPSDLSLVGQTVYVQALVFSDADLLGDAYFTNYTADVIIK